MEGFQNISEELVEHCDNAVEKMYRDSTLSDVMEYTSMFQTKNLHKTGITWMIAQKPAGIPT